MEENTRHVCFVLRILHIEMNVQTHSIHISCTDQSREKLINKEDSVEACKNNHEPRSSRSFFPPEFHKAQNNHQTNTTGLTGQTTNCSEIGLHVPLSSSSGQAVKAVCVRFAIFFTATYIHCCSLHQSLSVNLESKSVK